MTAPRDPARGRRDRLLVGHVDREQAIEKLKDAFVHGFLTKGELDLRAGQALAARTRADLATLTSDIPPAPAQAAPAQVAATPVAASPDQSPAPAPRQPLPMAVAWAAAFLVIGAAALRIAFLLDPGPNGPPGAPSAWDSPALFLLAAIAAGLTGLSVLAFGVMSAAEQRRSRGEH
jgi:DUF1707 SHOCT-like domain